MVLFIENEFCLDKEGALAGLALNRSVLDREVCARSHVTAPISHSATMKVMAARVTHVSQVYVNALDCEVCT